MRVSLIVSMLLVCECEMVCYWLVNSSSSVPSSDCDWQIVFCFCALLSQAKALRRVKCPFIRSWPFGTATEYQWRQLIGWLMHSGRPQLQQPSRINSWAGQCTVSTFYL